MLHLLLIVFICGSAFAMEEGDGLSVRKGEVVSYTALEPNALDRIYDSTKETHSLAISQKSDMPLCLQGKEGPFPFYGHPLDIELTALMTQYFASLKFDEEKTKTTEMRTEAEAIQGKEMERAIELLYDAGWKMGDPLAIQSLIQLLENEYSREILPKHSNLLSILKVYPKTEERLIEEIIISRQGLDYQKMEATSEELELSESEEDFDEKGETSALLGSGTLRHRRSTRGSA